MPIRRRVRNQASEGSTVGTGFPSRDRDDPKSLPSGPKDLYAVFVSPDHRHLAVIDRGYEFAVYALNGDRIGELLYTDDTNFMARVAWSPSGTKVAVVQGPYKVAVLDVATRKVTDLGRGTSVVFYPDGSRVAVADKSSLRIFDAVTLTEIREIELPEGAPNIAHSSGRRDSIDISPDGQWLACDTESCTIQILSTGTWELAYELTHHKNTITDVRWLDSDRLATSSADLTIRVFSMSGNRQLRVFEADNWIYGITYSAHLDLIVGWTQREYTAWSVTSGEIVGQDTLPVRADWGYRYISASPRDDLLVRLDGPALRDVTFSNGWDARRAQPPASVSTYANAKVLLLGDSGVGKSGLALVLAGEPFRATESTHARHIWTMQVPELNQQPDSQREVMLWDLAGQTGYRIVHQLHLDDGAVALILFDSRSETAPLAGIGYWARALQHAQAGGDSPPTYLVGARTDRGVVGVSDDRIAELVTEFGFRGYLRTSAKESWGVAELREAVLDAIDWTLLPVVTSSALFAAAKSFVLDQKAAGTLLTPLASLLAAFVTAPVTGPAASHATVGRDLLGTDQAGLRGVFEGCVARLESAGLVKRLAFGDLVMLQPELIDVYAGAIVNAARSEPDGLGAMLESRVLDVGFPFPAKERITDRQQERLLLIATIEELLRREVVLREETEDGVQLVFPGAFRRDLPESAEPADNTVEFHFEGPVDSIYATLVVRLARSNRFTRRGAFQSAAQFEADAGGICTVHLTRSDEGRGTFKIGYSQDVAAMVRFQFERFIKAHLERRATPGTARRVRLYRCPDCCTSFSTAQIELAVSRGRTSMVCPVCETRVPLDDPAVPGYGHDAVTNQMNASADEARSIAAASSIILGKEETTDFDVFLCHHGTDKPAVRAIARQLRHQGILPWLDEDELTPGLPWQQELERQIGNIRSAAVFVGPSGFGPWQKQELWAFLNEFADRGCPVIPVLLPGAKAPGLPIFLRGLTWVNLEDEDGFERLIWGVTGRRPVSSGLDQAAE